MRIMCKSKSVDQDKSQTIETSNYGFLNLSEDNLGMGIGEILLVVLLIMAVVMTWVYCVNKNKQRRMRELSSAINTASYRPGTMPVVQFDTPGNRVVSMQEQPTAPAQVQPRPLGLWDQWR